MVCVLSKDKKSGPDLQEQIHLPSIVKSRLSNIQGEVCLDTGSISPSFFICLRHKNINCCNAEKNNKYRNGYL